MSRLELEVEEVDRLHHIFIDEIRGRRSRIILNSPRHRPRHPRRLRRLPAEALTSSVHHSLVKHRNTIIRNVYGYRRSGRQYVSRFLLHGSVLRWQPAVTRLVQHDDSASGGGGTSLTISDCSEILNDVHLGDSISINGTCLTVTEFSKDDFKVGVSPETLRLTNLGSLKEGSGVNLERAVSTATRMGGHFVQGHVDTIATILETRPDGNAITFRLQPKERDVLRYVVKKGYVTLDGASLTVTAVDDKQGWWEIMLIAYTQEKVVMGKKKKGEDVNVEVDMVGKYVEKSVAAYFEGSESDGGALMEKMVQRMVDERLKSGK